MSKKLRNILQMMLAGIAMSTTVSCADSLSDSPGSSNLSRPMVVQLNVGAAPAANVVPPTDHYEKPSGENEKIRSLRIVIVDGNGRVEVNSSSNYTAGIVEHVVTAAEGEYKTVYLLANEPVYGSVDEQTYYDLAPVGSIFNKSVWQNLVVALSPSELGNRPLPMSAVYRIPVFPSLDTNGDDKFQYPAMQVLRAVTKFTVIAENRATGTSAANPSRDVIISNFRISSLADRFYLFPQVAATAANAFNLKPGQRMTHSMHFTSAFSLIEDATGLAPVVSGGDCPEGFDKSFSDHFRDNYIIPSDALHATYTGFFAPTAVPQGKSVTIGSFYANESRNFTPTGSYGYEIAFDIADAAGNRIGTYSGVLPNLPSLPRNTHCVITINIIDYSIEVDLVPYGHIDLEPEFGT